MRYLTLIAILTSCNFLDSTVQLAQEAPGTTVPENTTTTIPGTATTTTLLPINHENGNAEIGEDIYLNGKENDPSTPDDDAMACVLCHGDSGALISISENDETIYSFVRNGNNSPFMPAYPEAELSNQEVEDIAAYIHKGFQIIKAEDGDAANGANVYGNTCVGCHGADAMSGSAGIDLTVLNDLTILDAIRNGRTGMPSYDASAISNDEAEDIAAHIESL